MLMHDHQGTTSIEFFNRRILASNLERILSDSNFTNHRVLILRYFLTVLTRLRIHFLLGFSPVFIHPIEYCVIQKCDDSEVC